MRFLLNERIVTAGYKDPAYFRYWGRHHYGTDYKAIYAPLFAPCDIKITLVKNVDSGTGGRMIEFDDPWGFHHRLMHLQEIKVSKGQHIGSGNQIAVTGRSGSMTNSEGQIINYQPHLHTDIKNSKGEWVDPEWYYDNIINKGKAMFDKIKGYVANKLKALVNGTDGEPTVYRLKVDTGNGMERAILRKFSNGQVKIRRDVKFEEWVMSSDFTAPIKEEEVKDLPQF